MKRIISLLLAVFMAFSFAISVSAEALEQTPVMPRYTYIASTLVNITIDETTNVTTSNAFVCTYADYEVQITCKLQRYNNSKWNTVKTWTTSGVRYADLQKDWAVPSGYTYRTYATFSVYDSNGNLVESVSNYDSEYFPAQ